jgi:hypothetical protein
MDLFKGLQDKIASFTNSNEQQDLELGGQDEKELCNFIKNKVDESKNNPARITFENNVITNTAYLLGYDSVYFDSRSRQLRPYSGLAGYPQKSRVHANLVLPTIQNRLSRLAKNPPRYDVRPNTNGQEDKDAARLTLKVINNVWDQERINEKRIHLYMWMQQGGHAWGKVYWDGMKGKQFATPEGEIEHEGDIGFDVCSPLEVYIDTLAQRVSDAQWLIQAKVRKLAYFRNNYGEKGKEVKQEGAWLTSIQNLIKINNMSSKTQGGQMDTDMKDSAIEIAYYEKASKRYPEGRMIVIANGVLLTYKSLPCGEINFVKFDDIQVGGKFYSESVITHIRPLQDQFNRNLRRKAEFLNKGLNLKFISAKGAGLQESSLTDNTEVVQYNPVPNAEAPKAVTPPQLPQYVYTDGETLKADMAEISGISEVSKGQMPSASIPAIGMQLLQEADETRIGIVTESNENSWADVGRLIAKYAARYYNGQRYLKEAGQSGEYVVKEFTGEDLKESFDVVVVRGSTLPNSKTLKRQELLNAYQQGLLGDPNDPTIRRKLLEHLEFGDVSGIWEDQFVNDAQIKRSMDEIEQGLIPQIHPDDDHQAHFDYKNRLRKTDKFLSYPPEVKQIFLDNLEQHKAFIVQAVQAEAGPPPMGEPMPQDELPPEMDAGPGADILMDDTMTGEL